MPASTATSAAKPASARKPVAQAAAAATAEAAPAGPAPARRGKADKPKKPKLVRDSFTIPKSEYLVIDELKQRAARAGAGAKKSELLRAGIKLLARLDDAAFLAAMADVPTIKTGRPAKA
ncbi:hypothetical protein [Ramlibacter tataouinensis]|uniref:Uncharacterized protein n=1 Tax=Ramlibacter tataouinensis (strain ATCC BAA-407 / DSM 14655 / LMG 21543 / TTB310) TaxID=365046 RepID=F5Y158_RAMTT|nr:hypothetical protein [Ramlibacter tataouinensis]AEG93459.1 Conserved hypothetical protein [Ramlibacter tataouinensis TTB310]